MVEENKYEGVGDPSKILLEEALKGKSNIFMEHFAQILLVDVHE